MLKLALILFFLIFAPFPYDSFSIRTIEAKMIDQYDSETVERSGPEVLIVSIQEDQLNLKDSSLHQFIKNAKIQLSTIAQRISNIYSRYPEIPSAIVGSLSHMAGDKGTGYLIRTMLLFLVFFTVGIIAEKIVNIPIKNYKNRLESTIPDSLFQLISRLSTRVVIELFSLVVFALTVVGLTILFCPTRELLYELIMIYLPPIVVIRIAVILLCSLYSPESPHMRISPQNSPSAAIYYKGSLAFIIISLLTTKTLFLLKAHGMSHDIYILLYSHLGIAQFSILLAIVWIDRDRITDLIIKKRASSLSTSSASEHRMKRMWFTLVCLGLFGFELLWQVNLMLHNKDLVFPLLLTIFSVPFGFFLFSIGSRMLLIAAGHTELMDPRIINYDVLQKGADISQFTSIDLPPEPVSPTTVDGSPNNNESLLVVHFALIRKLMGFLIVISLIFWIMDLWGLDLSSGHTVFQSVINIFATLLLAYIFWEICRTFIDRKLEEDQAQYGTDLEEAEEGGEGSRKGTLLTLLRKALFALISVIVILIVLNAVGVNIGPMLAGAGILGLAVGFGSQTLVRDILSGVFYLMDDAFRVGDYIETAGTKGMVEYISLRSLRLRHPRGMVYTIPFGDMGSVQNFSRDYIITKLDIRVRYDVDVDKIRKVVKKINLELQENEEVGQRLLSRVKSQGVREMDDSAMILRVKFKTKPGDQFVVRREVYRKIQEHFRAMGIEFAHRNVTVYLPPEMSKEPTENNKALTSNSNSTFGKKVIEAGAAAAISDHQNDQSENKPKK